MDKSEIRNTYKAKRKSFSSSELNEMSEKITEQLKSMNLQGLTSIFLSIERFQEVNTKYMKSLLTDCEFAAPRMEGLELRHFILDEKAKIEVNYWGIPEPKSGTEVQASQFDVVIVPLLSVDNLGNRVGYGKGIYDRFLSKCKPECLFVGVSYFEPQEEMIEAHENDVPLNYLVTPNKIFLFER